MRLIKAAVPQRHVDRQFVLVQREVVDRVVADLRVEVELIRIAPAAASGAARRSAEAM